MNKVLKIILSVISSIIIFIVMIPIFAGLMLQIDLVQNYIVKKVSVFLTNKAGCEISIGRVNLDLFTNAMLSDVYMADHSGDTLIYAKEVSAKIDGINFITGKINLGTVNLNQAQCNLYRDSSGMMNIQRVFDGFKSENPKPSTMDFDMNVRQLNVLNTRFRMKFFGCPDQEYGVNFQDMDVAKIYFQAENIKVFNYDVRFAISHMSLREKSGFQLSDFNSSSVVVNETGLRFDNVHFISPRSDIKLSRLHMLYDSWWAYQNFIHDVRFDVVMEPSMVSYKTISAFTPRPTNINSVVFLTAVMNGPVSNMTGEVYDARVLNTYINAGFRIQGLPDVDNTVFNINLKSLKTQAKDIETIFADITDGQTLSSIESILKNSGDISLVGKFDGKINNFTTKAALSTNVGSVLGDLRLTRVAKNSQINENAIKLVGSTSSLGVNMGKLLGVDKLGNVSFNANVDVLLGDDDVDLNTHGVIEKFVWNSRVYDKVVMDGNFSGRKFTGHVKSYDKALNFETDGMFDFNSDIPSYNFEMDLYNANLVEIGVNHRDPVSELSAKIKAHASGTTLDNANGWLIIDDILYVNQIDTVRAGKVSMESVNNAQLKKFVLNSDFADIELKGEYSYSDMFTYLKKTISRYIPSLKSESQLALNQRSVSIADALPNFGGVASQEDQRNVPYLTDDNQSGQDDSGYYMIKLNVKQANNVASIFMPGLQLAKGTQLTFYFNPRIDKFNLNFSSDFIERQNNLIENLTINSRNYQDSVTVLVKADYLGIGNMDIPNLMVDGAVKNNMINIEASFSDSEAGSAGLINTQTFFNTDEYNNKVMLNTRIYPSIVKINNRVWNVSECSVDIDSTLIAINNFIIESQDQRLKIDGLLGGSDQDTIAVNVDNLDISPLSFLVENLGYGLSGMMNGQAKGVNVLNNPKLFAKLDLRSLAVNQDSLPDVTFLSVLDNNRNNIKMSVVTKSGYMPVKGYYNLKQKYFDVDMNFDSIKMSLLEPILQGILINSSGWANANLNLSGVGSKINLNGDIDVKDYSVQIGFTKARYKLENTKVSVKNNRFELPNTKITDGINGSGTLSAWFDSDYFKNLRFNVVAIFENLLALDTKPTDQELFYGKVFGSGAFKVWGDEQTVNMDIVATSADNSVFVLPLPDVASISEADFISFVPPASNDSTATKITKRELRNRIKEMLDEKVSSQLKINMILNVMPNALAQIIMDEQTGSMVEGRGEGQLIMSVNPNNNQFTMNGQLEIQSGIYRFVLPDIALDKRFNIQNGGQIIWNGDPANPIINVNAVYSLKTSLATLQAGNVGGGSGGYVNVDCGINLSGNMLSPDIKLSISAPSAPAEVQNLISNLINTQEATTTQFVSLLLNRSFLPDFSNANVGTMTSSLVGATLSEFLSNQISSLISNNKFNFRFGYRLGDNTMPGDEVNVEFGSEIIENVLSVEVGGNFNSGNNINSNASPFSGDANLTWTINKAGTLKLKGFTRPIERFDETQGLQESGVGVYFRQDFQNLRDLKARYKKWRQEVKQKRQSAQEKRFKQKGKRDVS